MEREHGQATVEWVALMALAALVLGALATLRGPAADPGLGVAVAKRIRCAAAGGCATATAPPTATAPGAPAGAAAPQAIAPPPPRSAPRVAPPARAAPGSRPARRPARASPHARVIDAFRRLRGLRAVGKRVWIACLGYKRFRYELEHPLLPTETMPLGDALEIADECLNPLSFLGDD